MLMTAYGASVGGLLTPIGSPPNLIGREFIQDQTDTIISFFDWVLAALPIVAVMFVALCVILIALNRPEIKKVSGAGEYIAEERRKLGSFSRGERNTLIAFGAAVLLWILPGVIGLIYGDTSETYTTIYERLNEGVVAIIAAGLLFVLPIDLAQEAIHVELARGGADRLGDDPAVWWGHRSRLAARVNGPGQGHGGFAGPIAGLLQPAGHHDPVLHHRHVDLRDD
jgi:di/tricarboxylate transporter